MGANLESNIQTTIDSYNQTAEAYAKNVKDIVLNEAIDKFLRLLPKGALILDVGCGSGRDARIFSDKGYKEQA